MKATKFDICAAKVREIPCAQCRYFMECLERGRPASDLGNYIAVLEVHSLRAIERWMRPITALPNLTLHAFVPTDEGTKRAAYAEIRGYVGKDGKLALKVELPRPMQSDELRHEILFAFVQRRAAKKARKSNEQTKEDV